MAVDCGGEECADNGMRRQLRGDPVVAQSRSRHSTNAPRHRIDPWCVVELGELNAPCEGHVPSCFGFSGVRLPMM
jgi:hypothetical protein